MSHGTDPSDSQRPEELRAQVEENLRALGAEHVAIVNLRRSMHRPGSSPRAINASTSTLSSPSSSRFATRG